MNLNPIPGAPLVRKKRILMKQHPVEYLFALSERLLCFCQKSRSIKGRLSVEIIKAKYVKM